MVHLTRLLSGDAPTGPVERLHPSTHFGQEVAADHPARKAALANLAKLNEPRTGN